MKPKQISILIANLKRTYIILFKEKRLELSFHYRGSRRTNNVIGDMNKS